MKKHVKVLTNDPHHPCQTLIFSGAVDRFVTISPKVVRFIGDVGKTLKQDVRIVPEEKYPFKIISVRADKGQRIRFELQPSSGESADEKGYTLTVEDHTNRKGRYRDMIRLQTDSDIQPVIAIRVYGNRFEKRPDKTTTATPGGKG